MLAHWYRFRQLLHFYGRAVTKYQIHSPFVFELVDEVLDDDRWYYAFRDIERLRSQMLDSRVEVEFTDLGARSGSSGAKRKVAVRDLVRRAASSPGQGRMLFRLVNRLAPKTILELGTSLGIGALYLASAARAASLVSLEGDPECARLARANLDMLKLDNVEVISGPFEKTLPVALDRLQRIDFVFVDGNHRPDPTLASFEACLSRAHDKTAFVFDDVYWSPGMRKVWQQIQRHPRVTLTVDFFDLSLAFINPDFKEKQHFSVVRTALKPWKVF